MAMDYNKMGINDLRNANLLIIMQGTEWTAFGNAIITPYTEGVERYSILIEIDTQDPELLAQAYYNKDDDNAYILFNCVSGAIYHEVSAMLSECYCTPYPLNWFNDDDVQTELTTLIDKITEQVEENL